MKTTTVVQATAIANSLSSPWGITSLPYGRLLITEKAGRMRIVTTTGTVGNIITGIPTVNSSGQGGLLGLCIDPLFSTNRMVYWVFTENVTGGTLTAIAKGKLSNDEANIENATVIYRSGPAANNGNAHYGGRVIFDQTGNLVVSIGERAYNNTRELVQSVSGSLGNSLALQPLAYLLRESQYLLRQEHCRRYSFGHRNPQGIAFHPVTKELWQSEHGPRGGDEINLVKPG